MAQDYRSILRDELASRKSRNRNYNQAAFARDIGISTSMLCEVFSGNHGLSREKAEKIAKKIGLNAPEQNFFCDLVESEHARSKRRRVAVQKRVLAKQQGINITKIASDTFKSISEWYHLAILELTTLSAFKSDNNWIARFLGIDSLEAERAVARLERMGMLGKVDGKLSCIARRTETMTPVPSKAIRDFHRCVLEKAATSLETQGMERRYVSSAVLAIDKSRIKEAMEQLEKFRRDFCNEQHLAPKKDGLYGLSIQFFDLQQGE